MNEITWYVNKIVQKFNSDDKSWLNKTKFSDVLMKNQFYMERNYNTSSELPSINNTSTQELNVNLSNVIISKPEKNIGYKLVAFIWSAILILFTLYTVNKKVRKYLDDDTSQYSFFRRKGRIHLCLDQPKKDSRRLPINKSDLQIPLDPKINYKFN